MSVDTFKIGNYRLGTNLPFRQGALWENVARASRWGAPVIELNTQAETLGRNALQVIKEQAKANNLVYTWHVPPNPDQGGELALPDPLKNDFGRKVLAEAIKASEEVGAKHITFHATNSVGRAPEGKIYIYDVRTDSVQNAVKLPNMSVEKNVELLNDSAKAQITTQINDVEWRKKLIDNLDKQARALQDEGVVGDLVKDIGLSVRHASHVGGMIGIQPDNPGKWTNIQSKVLSNQDLNDDEKSYVKDYAERVSSQTSGLKMYYEAQLRQLEPWKNKDVVFDGVTKMTQNVADNIAQLPTEVLKTAVNKGITLGFENLPGTFLFSTAEELIDLRKKTVDKLVSENKLSRPDAEKLIGFTFDTAHANITKNMNIAGLDFKNPAELLEKLGPAVKHVHAVDGVGTFDAHLPLGQGEIGKEHWNKIKEALEKIGFKGTSIFELGPGELPVTYGSSSQFLEPGMYMTSGNQPTMTRWGPSYVEAGMSDPLMLQKDTGYFYESFGEVF